MFFVFNNLSSMTLSPSVVPMGSIYIGTTDAVKVREDKLLKTKKHETFT